MTFELFAVPMITLFIEDTETVRYGINFLRIAILATPFMICNFQMSFTFQAMGKTPGAFAFVSGDLSERRPQLLGQLDQEMQQFTADEGLFYVRDDDSIKRPFDEPPIVVNYFFHEEIIPSAKRKKKDDLQL